MIQTQRGCAHLRTPVGLLAALGLALLMSGGCDGSAGRDADDPRLRTGAELLWELPGEVQSVLLEPDALLRAERLAQLLRSLPPAAIDDVLEGFETVFLDIGDFELELLGEWWARFDPETAMAWSKQDWRASHHGVGLTILRTWARDDPEAALRASEVEPQLWLRRAKMAAVLRGWEEGGHPGSFEFVSGLGTGHDGQRLMGYVAQRKVLRDGVDATLEWADSQPGPNDLVKLNLVRRVASAAAEVEPEKAAAWAEKHMAEQPRNRLPQRVATRWVKRDPDAAMRWLETLEPGSDRDTGVREAYRIWLREDKPAAWAWMESLEPEPWQDEARALYARSWFKGHLDSASEAIEHARQIDRETLRWATVGRIWRVWQGQDDQAATAWFIAEQEDMPEFYRNRIPIGSTGLAQPVKPGPRPRKIGPGQRTPAAEAARVESVEDAASLDDDLEGEPELDEG